MIKKKAAWWSGFVGGVAVMAAAACGLHYYQYGTLPFAGDSLVTGSSARKTAAIEKIINEQYLEETDEETLADGMYAGMLASLEDPYSGYFSAENYRKLKESMEGKYTGIGLVMQQNKESGEISVVQCYKGSPAWEAGIQAGDIICMVNGQSVEELDVTELSKTIRSDESGEIQLSLKRENEIVQVTVRIEEVEIPVVSSRMLENSVGYIRIQEFTDGTSGQFAEILKELQSQEMKGLIFDLRENPGGLLDAVCDTLEQILPEGLIVYTEDKNGKRIEYKCKGENPLEIPAVVLVNENSASAAEIFAGAVKDHNVAKLVGTTTFGKGIVQKTFPLSDGSAVKVTTSKYYTPSGVNIHGTGITPDVEVELTDEQKEEFFMDELEELSLEEWIHRDAQMEAAWLMFDH